MTTAAHPAFPHEPLLSESDRWALTATSATIGWPGHEIGIALWDMQAAAARAANPE